MGSNNRIPVFCQTVHEKCNETKVNIRDLLVKENNNCSIPTEIIGDLVEIISKQDCRCSKSHREALKTSPISNKQGEKLRRWKRQFLNGRN